MRHSVQVAVTGAAGQIGYALVFRIASGEMFGSETPVALTLIDVPEALPALKGLRMEIDDCAFSALSGITVTADYREGFRGAEWAILAGGMPRQAGMERSDLLTMNGKIFVEQGRALDEAAADSCRVLVVANPCNTNAFIAARQCRRLPHTRFFAMTMLDQNRAVSLLAQRAGVSPARVRRLAVWGNHSATQFPDFYHATIDDQSAVLAVSDEKWLQNEFVSTVQQRGAAVIRARGKSSAASAAQAVIDTVRSVAAPTDPGGFFSLAVVSDGSYGIEEGLVFSFPVRSDGQAITIVGGLAHNDFARGRLAATARELQEERDAVRALV